jgi:hypothetical protein
MPTKQKKASVEENAVKEHILKADQASRQPAVTGNLLEPHVARQAATNPSESTEPQKAAAVYILQRAVRKALREAGGSLGWDDVEAVAHAEFEATKTTKAS